MERVLIVEDDRDIAELLSVMLSTGGMEVRAVTSATAALAIIEEFGPQAVLTDLNMEQMDGLELCLALRATPRFSDVPILIYTAANHDDARLVEAQGLAFVEVTAKPMGAAALTAKIRTLLQDK